MTSTSTPAPSSACPHAPHCSVALGCSPATVQPYQVRDLIFRDTWRARSWASHGPLAVVHTAAPGDEPELTGRSLAAEKSAIARKGLDVLFAVVMHELERAGCTGARAEPEGDGWRVVVLGVEDVAEVTRLVGVSGGGVKVRRGRAAIIPSPGAADS